MCFSTRIVLLHSVSALRGPVTFPIFPSRISLFLPSLLTSITSRIQSYSTHSTMHTVAPTWKHDSNLNLFFQKEIHTCQCHQESLSFTNLSHRVLTISTFFYPINSAARSFYSLSSQTWIWFVGVPIVPSAGRYGAFISP